MFRRRWILAAAGLVFLTWLAKPAVVRMDDRTRPALFFRWQRGEIRFVNSVTDRPVAIAFKVGRRFHDFRVLTDPGTESYYTHGLYDMNAVLSGDAADRLAFCSVKGIFLSIGSKTYAVKDGCLEVALLWTIW